ncbi:leucine-rich repeat-containing protein 53 [Pseudophryne corroboree]|uniref:leucine-rich repeat-containing protein 53 n=1 Tax=Pseudophryne corroboree TaxID=495146 RepID=UPI003081EDC1
MITDGNITSIGVTDFSYLSNLTLLRLSSNKIQEIQAGAFLKLTQLRSLVLDNNQLSAASVSRETFLPLRNLETLQLNNNYFASISGTWFESTKRLIKLEINQNQITKLTHHSLGPNAFRSLEHLDLSSNFISSIQEETFLGLEHLRELDLSKNRLTKLPGVFSSLSHLSLLNLGQNRWNCTCELHELAHYLRNYTYSTSRILRNRNGLRCIYSSNPGVKSLLQLTEWNCAPRSYNISASSREGDRGYFREAIFITILVLAGVIAALFLIIFLIAVKCNLRPRDSTDSTCCGSAEARDFPGIRSHVPKIHVSQANNGDVVSFVDPARSHNPYMKKNTGSVLLGHNPAGSGKSFRASSKENVPGSYYVCFRCRLVQWRPTCPPVMSDAEGAGSISNRIQGITYNKKHFVRGAPWAGATTAAIQGLSRCDRGATSIRGSFPPPPSVLPGVKSDDTRKPDPVYSILERGPRKLVSY